MLFINYGHSCYDSSKTRASISSNKWEGDYLSANIFKIKWRLDMQFKLNKYLFFLNTSISEKRNRGVFLIIT